MKKIIALLLALSMLLCFVGCGKEEAEPEAAPAAPAAPVANGWSFNYNGTEIAISAEAAPIVEALGEPKSYTEETSCAFEGLDKTYFYGNFYMTTYPQGDKDYVFSMWFVDDTLTTAEGIYIGAEQAEVEAAYGADAFNGTNAYVVEKGESKLMILITDGCVSSIQYELIVA